MWACLGFEGVDSCQGRLAGARRHAQRVLGVVVPALQLIRSAAIGAHESARCASAAASTPKSSRGGAISTASWQAPAGRSPRARPRQRQAARSPHPTTGYNGTDAPAHERDHLATRHAGFQARRPRRVDCRQLLAEARYRACGCSRSRTAIGTVARRRVSRLSTYSKTAELTVPTPRGLSGLEEGSFPVEASPRPLPVRKSAACQCCALLAVAAPSALVSGASVAASARAHPRSPTRRTSPVFSRPGTTR